VVARAEPTTSKQASLADDPSQLFWNFCNCTGHNQLICNNAESVETTQIWTSKRMGR
jgi:hypothetical protein